MRYYIYQNCPGPKQYSICLKVLKNVGQQVVPKKPTIFWLIIWNTNLDTIRYSSNIIFPVAIIKPNQSPNCIDCCRHYAWHVPAGTQTRDTNWDAMFGLWKSTVHIIKRRSGVQAGGIPVLLSTLTDVENEEQNE